jgi:hypothetical protein
MKWIVVFEQNSIEPCIVIGIVVVVIHVVETHGRVSLRSLPRAFHPFNSFRLMVCLDDYSTPKWRVNDWA